MVSVFYFQVSNVCHTLPICGSELGVRVENRNLLIVTVYPQREKIDRWLIHANCGKLATM